MRNSIQNNHVIAFHMAQETLAWQDAEFFAIFGDERAEESELLALHHADAHNAECAHQRTNNQGDEA